MTLSQNLPQTHARVLRTLEATALPYSFKGSLGTAVAGLSHMLHGHIDYLARHMLPDSATGEHLDRWAAIWGLRRKEATRARVTLRVNGGAGVEVPRDWLVDGREFLVEAGQTLERETTEVVAIAREAGPLGVEAKSASVVNTSARVESAAEVVSFEDGIPAEGDESLRRRLMRCTSRAPQGGAYADYIDWVEAVPGIDRAWVKTAYLLEKSGHVEVAALGSNAALEEARKLLGKLAPAAAQVTVVKPGEVPIKVEFVCDPTTEEVRTKAQANIAELFAAEAEPRGYLDETGRLCMGTIYISRIAAAISAVPEERSHRIISPTTDIEVNDGEIATYET